MKAKHVLWVFSAIVAIVAMAAGVALLVDRFVLNKECPDGYLECDTDDFEIAQPEEA